MEVQHSTTIVKPYASGTELCEESSHSLAPLARVASMTRAPHPRRTPIPSSPARDLTPSLLCLYGIAAGKQSWPGVQGEPTSGLGADWTGDWGQDLQGFVALAHDDDVRLEADSNLKETP
jgi:hypothetical protein